MPRFSRKPSEKETKKLVKPEKTEKNKSKKSKSKESQTQAPKQKEEDEEEEEESQGVGVQRCRRLLASCPKRPSSAKCAATFKRKSRLSKNLLEVLVDDSVLTYFMEFMQEQNAVNLLNFWLTAETFRLSTISRLKINSLSRLKSSKLEDTLVNGGEDVNDSSKVFTTNVPLDSKNQSLISPRERILSDSSSDSEFGCFTGYTESQQHKSEVSTLLEQLSIGSILFCDKCGNIITKESETCSICAKEANSPLINEPPDVFKNIVQNQPVNINSREDLSSVDSTTDFKIGKERTDNITFGNEASTPQVPARKVTFDLEPDFENEEREFCRRRTRSIVIDAVSIYSKYISLEATHPFGLDEPLRRQVEANICSEDGKIDPDCFVPAQKFAFDVMERMYFPTFLQSTLYCKHQIDILTSGKVFLSDILYNEHAMFYFMEFLDQEGMRHLLEFWLTADNFQSMLQIKIDKGSYNGEQALDDAMIIYERYFSMQASLPLGFDDVTRIHIENSICREDGPLPECFAIPMEHILCLLEEVFFPSFLQSEIYFHYLTERLNSVTDHASAHGHEASGGEAQKGNRTADEKTRLVTSFGSDLDLSENPDAIWHRPNKGPLSLGSISEYGIFEPIFEPEPDSGNNLSKAAKLGKAMRKLVSGGEDKAKEEMAWKIAKMMIEDVHSQQLNAKNL